MIKWLGENGGELVGTNKYLCVQKKDLCVQIRFFYRLHRGCSSRGSRMLCWHYGTYRCAWMTKVFPCNVSKEINL
jgi:hypothetical protein